MRLAMIQTQQKESEQVLLDIDQVVEMLNLSKPTIYEWVAKRKIPFTKMGSRTLFPRNQIMKFIADNTFFPKDTKVSSEKWFREKLEEFKDHPEFIIEGLKLEISHILAHCLDLVEDKRLVDKMALRREIKELLRLLD